MIEKVVTDTIYVDIDLLFGFESKFFLPLKEKLGTTEAAKQFTQLRNPALNASNFPCVDICCNQRF